MVVGLVLLFFVFLNFGISKGENATNQTNASSTLQNGTNTILSINETITSTAAPSALTTTMVSVPVVQCHASMGETEL